MATDNHDRVTIIGKVGLLAASFGILAGLLEAGFLLLPNWPLPLMKPSVPPSFWFFAPLLTSLVFGLAGLLIGVVVAWVNFRYVRILLVAAMVGLIGGYFQLLFNSYPSAKAWFIYLREMITPTLAIAVVAGFTIVVLLVTWKPNTSLGVFSNVPLRPRALVALGLMSLSAIALGISHLPSFAASRRWPVAKNSPPNFILIVLDTTRADHFSSYGYFRNTTPFMDAFAKQGVLFENGISASCWTLPSMGSIFTNLLPHQHGAGGDVPLGNGPRTLAEIMKAGGYETVGINANYIYGLVPWGLARGFDTYIDSTNLLGYSLHASLLGHDFVEPVTERLFHRSRFYMLTAQQVGEEAERWFNHRSGRPFFLYLNYMDVHDPYESPDPYDREYGEISEDAKRLIAAVHYSQAQFTPSEREGMIAAYDGGLSYMDHEIGGLLRFLKTTPEWSNTYVIITADHGEAFGEHHSYGHGWDLYREVLHVPLIMTGPGIPAGMHVSHIARTRLIFPTVLELAGANAPVLHQTGLTRLWNGHYIPNNPEEATISEDLNFVRPPAPQGMISVTTREWQFIYQPGEHNSKLYHWVTDPQEQQNVADLPENQPVVDHLRSLLLAIIERSYRPWRDPRYLIALTDLGFSPDREAGMPAPLTAGGLQILHGAGAAQALFPPNPENPSRISSDDMVRSIPYGEP